MLPSLRNFAITFAVSLAIFGALAYFLAGFAMDSFSRGFVQSEKENGEADTGEGSETEGVFNPFDDTEENETTTIQGTSFNFVLVGLDYQKTVFEDYHESMGSFVSKALSGKQDEDVRNLLTYEMKRAVSADAIIVGRVDKEDRRLVLTALSGNTHVFVDGVNTTLGSVLVDKGLDFFLGKVTALTGFPVDYYSIVTIPAMESILTSIGGVSFNVPCDMVYEDPIEELEIDIKAGSQWLSGEDAVKVLRYAGYEDRDVSRMAVMREMMASVLTSASKVTTLANAPTLFNTLKNSMTTNMKLSDFTDNLDLIFRMSDFEIVSYAYPGRMAEDNGDPVFVPDTSAAIAALLPYR